MDNQYRYDAFISYRHLEPDKPVAVRLQELMESYVPPKGVFPQGKGRKLRLFRDETELPTSSDLRYRDTGWLFDFEKFEIIYRIDDYCGIDANAENVYLERYDQLMSCRLPSARDVLKKVQSMQ